MGKYASGKYALAISDRSGMAFPYDEMVREWNGSLVHFSEFEAKQPQLQPKPVGSDPQALYNPRPQPASKTSLILLDNNSLCKEGAKFINKKDICKIIFCDKLNLSQKRNYGALIAESKHLIFSDDDDIWEFNKGELTIKSLNHSQVVCHEYSKFGVLSKKPKFIIGKKKKYIKYNF